MIRIKSHQLLLALLLAASPASAQQFARPDSTIVAGGWTVGDGVSASLWEAIDETSPDDATTHDRTSFQGSGETMELGLSNVTDPAVSTGHIVRARFERSGPAGGVHDICLFQGGTQIACLGSTADPASWATDSFTLRVASAPPVPIICSVLAMLACQPIVPHSGWYLVEVDTRLALPDKIGDLMFI